MVRTRKVAKAEITINGELFIAVKPSRFRMDEWEREYGMQRLAVKMGRLSNKQESIARALDKGGINPEEVEKLMLTYDENMEDISKMMDEPMKIGNYEISRSSASRASLLAMSIVNKDSLEPLQSINDWLEEDTTLFSSLGLAVEQFVFQVGEMQRDLFTHVMTKLTEYPPDKDMKVSDFIDLMRTSYEDVFEGGGDSKKSGNAYGATVKVVETAK